MIHSIEPAEKIYKVARSYLILIKEKENTKKKIDRKNTSYM